MFWTNFWLAIIAILVIEISLNIKAINNNIIEIFRLIDRKDTKSRTSREQVEGPSRDQVVNKLNP